MWDNYQDEKGIAVTEKRDDYSRFLTQEVYVPSGWTGKMPNGDQIKSGVKFIDIRSKYLEDPDWARVKKELDAGKPATMTYHRFWAQCEFAVATGSYAILFPEDVTNPTLSGDVNGDGTVDALDLAAMKKHLLDKSFSINTVNADLNKDGDINALDFALLRKFMLG